MKVAIIGVGRMGRRHIQAVRKMGLDLVGVFDISHESLRLAQEENGLANDILFKDVDELFHAVSPDCAIVATTADFHSWFTCLCAERGVKYILVEKPMATSLEECDRMIESCKRHGSNLAVNHQVRFMSVYEEPKKLLDTAAFGGMASMTLVAGNVGFSMNGVHYFEAFRFLTGEKIEEVTAWFSKEEVPNPRGVQFQDRAGSLRAVTASGKRLYMDIGADQGHGMRVMYGCRLGAITVDEVLREMETTQRTEANRGLPSTRVGSPGENMRRTLPFCDAIETTVEVLNALFSGENSVTGENGRSAVEVLVAAYHSNDRGSVPVRIDGELDRTRRFPWA